MTTPLRLLAVLTIAVLFIVDAPHAQQSPESLVQFAALDVVVESAEPVAAWQFELAERGGRMTVVGVENGESPAFGNAPYYDLDAVAADRADRIVVADFLEGEGAQAPTGSTRIATIHVRLTGAGAPDYDLRLIAAGNAAGEPIDAEIRLDTRAER